MVARGRIFFGALLLNIKQHNQVATKFKSRVFGPLIFKFVFVVVIEHQGRTLINLCFYIFKFCGLSAHLKRCAFVLQCIGRLRSSPGTGVGSPIPPRFGIAPTLFLFIQSKGFKHKMGVFDKCFEILPISDFRGKILISRLTFPVEIKRIRVNWCPR